MVQKLEAIKGGGGSIRVGATGTISALMTRELESIKRAPRASVSHQDKLKTVSVSVPCSVTTSKRLQARKSLDEASSSSTNHKRPETAGKMKSYTKSTDRIPMLWYENVTLDRTPSREKTNRKGAKIVEVVDIKCGHPDKAWPSHLTSRLKKLGFSQVKEACR